MSKYRKKPIVVEAKQWWPGTKVEGVCPGISPEWGRINTLEGWLTVSPGDWIITGIKGEKYPCKPDIFEATYEPA